MRVWYINAAKRFSYQETKSMKSQLTQAYVSWSWRCFQLQTHSCGTFLNNSTKVWCNDSKRKYRLRVLITPLHAFTILFLKCKNLVYQHMRHIFMLSIHCDLCVVMSLWGKFYSISWEVTYPLLKTNMKCKRMFLGICFVTTKVLWTKVSSALKMIITSNRTWTIFSLCHFHLTCISECVEA